MDVLKELFDNQDLDYKKFHKKLVPTIDENLIIGVRLPIIRKIAKSSYLENAEVGNKYYEEKMIKGLMISHKKCDADEHINDLMEFVELIDNWAICDSCASSYKFTKKYKKEIWDFLLSLIGESEYKTRFAIVMMMDYYIDDEYVDEVINELLKIKSDKYYVNMALAWALSVIYIKYRELILPLLEEKCFSQEVHNMTISKIRDSFRVSKEDKETVKKLRY